VALRPCPDGLLIISLAKRSVPCDNNLKKQKKNQAYFRDVTIPSPVLGIIALSLRFSSPVVVCMTLYSSDGWLVGWTVGWTRFGFASNRTDLDRRCFNFCGHSERTMYSRK
jgi:hypothetical protein